MKLPDSNKFNLPIILLICAIFFTLLRFIKIEADFPPGIEKGGILYTDEGWYANAAINRIVNGTWHLEGDFNPAVNLPVSHIVQAGAFMLFGMSLATARCTIVFFFIVLMAALFLLTARYAGRAAAAMAVFLLSVNYITFVYSRLAILEIPMMGFTACSLLLAASFRRKNDPAMVILSSVLLAAAALTKSTAFFALPILLYLSFLRGDSRKEKAIFPAVSLLVFMALLFAYNIAASRLFPGDFAYFTKANFENRLQLSPALMAGNIAYCLLNAFKVEPIAYPLGVLSCLFLLFRSSRFRRNVLVHISLLWIIVYVVIIGSTSYHPPRYFLPLSVPSALLFSMSVFALREHLKKELFLLAELFVVTYFLTFNGYKILTYLNTPDYSFATMSKEVKQIVASEGDSAVLLGSFANSVSCATGIRSINTAGTRPLEWRLKNYRPRFYLKLGAEAYVMDTLSQEYELTYIATWNVFNNYLKDRKVHLFRLDPGENSDW